MVFNGCQNMSKSADEKKTAAKRNWLAPVKPEKMSWGHWLIRRLAVIFVLATVILIGGGLIFKDELIFHPYREVDATPKNYGYDFKEVWLQTADGLRVKAWDIPAEPGERREAVLFFQGNSGNMGHIMAQLMTLRSLGLTVMAIDYPGYGESEGRPTVDSVYQTAEALWQYALSRGFTSENIIIYGFSLGGGVASYLTEKHPPAALVLDSTFTRLRDVPSEHLPFLKPYLKLVLGDILDTKSRLANIHCPLLVLHSPDDTVVPYDLGRDLFETYQGGSKEMVTGHGGHMDFLLNQKLYSDGLQKLMDTAWPPPHNSMCPPGSFTAMGPHFLFCY